MISAPAPPCLRRALAALTVGASLAFASPSTAQQGTDAATAEALFREGRKQMEEQHWAEACPKLAESARLERRPGTLLALAICREKEGKTATAWATYADVLAIAKRENRPEREKAAAEGIATLEPKLSRLTITVPVGLRALAGLEVRRDGELLGTGAWGSAIPLDPGTHEIVATATGKLAHRATVTLGDNADLKTVELPATLADAPVAAPPPVVPPAQLSPAAPRPSEEAKPSGARKAVGYSLIGLGAVGLVTGTVFALRVQSKQSAARALCPTSPCSDQGGVDLNGEARSAYPIALVGLAVGVVAGAAGAYLLLSSSTESPVVAALRPTPGGGAASIEGRW